MDSLQFLAQLFFNRRDEYAVQTESGKRYLRSAVLGNRGRWAYLTEEVDHRLIHRHLVGTLTIATYTPYRDRTKWLCFDFDGHGLGPLEKVGAFLQQAFHVVAHLERSRRGGHLWLFFQAPAKASKVRTLAKHAIKEAGVGKLDFEVFPKTDDARAGFGNAMRLPFGVHRATGERYLFAGIPGRTWQQQLAWFQENVYRMPLERLAQIVASIAPTEKTPQRAPVPDRRPITGSYVTAIKEKLPMLKLARRLTTLKSSDGGKGRFYLGRCPLAGHNDVHPSFWVDVEFNIANCFKPNCASEKPMDVVNLWARHRGVTDGEAIRELSAQLGFEVPPAELLIRIPGLGFKPLASPDGGKSRDQVLEDLVDFLNGLCQRDVRG